MSIGAGNPEPLVALKYWAATDPIPPVLDLNIPIPDHKPPPLADDFFKRREQRRRKNQQTPAEPAENQNRDGHIDDYA